MELDDSTVDSIYSKMMAQLAPEQADKPVTKAIAVHAVFACAVKVRREVEAENSALRARLADLEQAAA